MTGDRPLHVGVDDVFDAFLEASDRGATLWAHPLFATLAALHAEFHLCIDLYVFLAGSLAGRLRSLREVAPRVRDELAHAPWLRLGPHGLDYERPPYRQPIEQQRATFAALYGAIDRLVPPCQRSRWVRLHCFSESYELADLWRTHGVEALLTTDRPAVSYHLPAAVRAQLADRGVVQHQGVTLRRTHERVETLAAARLAAGALGARLDAHVARHGFLTLCTHEKELRQPEVAHTLKSCLRHAERRGWPSW